MNGERTVAMSDARPDIQIVGHVCVDLTPQITGEADITPGVLTEVGPMSIRIGGAVGNGSRVARGMGFSAAMSGTVGSDALGQLCRTSLEDFHPGAVDLAEAPRHATSYSVVVQLGDTDRSFWHHTGANDEFDGTCELLSARILHFGYPTLVPAMTRYGGQPTVALFQRARQQGSLTSLDLAYCASNSPLKSYDWGAYFRNVLPVTDVFCPSWDDVTSALNRDPDFDEAAVGECAQEFLDWGAKVVLVTAGEHGAFVASRTRDGEAISAWISAAPVPRFVSTNGAGDTFKVAFLLSSLGTTDVREAARLAADVVARHIGGLPLLGTQ